MKAALAVLDLDGTLLEGFLAEAVTKVLLAVPGAEVCAVRRARSAIDAYRARVIDHDECAAHFHDAYARSVRGLPAAVLGEVGAQGWRLARGQLFPHARRLVRALRAQGFSPCLLSGSPQEAVLHAARDLGVEHAWGLVLETDPHGRCTERYLRAPASSGVKGAILREATAGIPVDWRQSLAMGDSPSDIDVLDMVGHPLAYEPDAQLRAIAVAKGWTVVDRTTVLDICGRLRPETGATKPHERPPVTWSGEAVSNAFSNLRSTRRGPGGQLAGQRLGEGGHGRELPDGVGVDLEAHMVFDRGEKGDGLDRIQAVRGHGHSRIDFPLREPQLLGQAGAEPLLEFGVERVGTGVLHVHGSPSGEWTSTSRPGRDVEDTL
ncbi:HAD family phosphatase [Streptomyces daliensis]|uniref:HAD family phosphatase n=1 Tax=Streptomyces daliensis TaxID=299421 RepID=A0A8T4IKZ6_9ACTN|nr:HAD family phosphatase [Streptomyces daliensis]